MLLVHLRKREFDPALLIAERLAEAQPDNPIPLNLMGAAYEGKEDPETARAHYQSALELKPDYATAALNLARLELQSGDVQASKRRYQQVLESNPDNFYALEALARFALQEGNPQQSVALLEKARAANPTAISPRLLLAGLYLRTAPKSALAIAEEAYQINPRHPDVLLNKARAQLANGQPQPALAIYQGMLETYPESAAFHYHLGLAQAGVGNPEAAKESWGKTLELEPNHLEASHALARLSYATGALDAALTAARDLQTNFTSTPAGYILEGDVLGRQGRAQEAIVAYQAAQAIQPQSAVAAKVTAAYRQLGELDTAHQSLVAWLESHPGDVAIRTALAASYHSSGNKQEALKHYESALNLNDNNAIVLNNMAWIYYEQEDARALDTAKRAYELVPDRAEIADTYGWFLVQAGQIEQGLSLLARAVDQAPNNYDIRYHHAAALALAGDELRAREELQALLSDEQQFAERKAAQALLQTLQ